MRTRSSAKDRGPFEVRSEPAFVHVERLIVSHESVSVVAPDLFDKDFGHHTRQISMGRERPSEPRTLTLRLRH